MARFFRAVGWILLAAVLAAVAGGFWYRFASLPQIDGRLQLGGTQGAASAAGPRAPIDIVRDGEGIPHIYAASPRDAYFALGFAHAQDRLWQLELNRRIPAGRMAEILGSAALPTDRFLRTLGVRRNAEAILGNLSPDTRAVLEAYAEGINAWLAQRSGPLPPEFLLTGAPAPEPWHPVDSIGWQTMMAWDLGANWTQELLRMRLSQKFSLDQINAFLPPYPGDPVLQTRDYTGLYRELKGTTRQLTGLMKSAPPSWVEGMGSNSWVLSGALTKSGKPLLANDPHLGLSAPALWYMAHLSAPGLNTIGATLPGIPAVVLGHNDRIAWGFTNTAPDVQDLYIERIDPANPNRYQTPDGWADFETRKETIRVKGEPDVVIDVRTTRHGPVISGASGLVDRASTDLKQYVVAFAWTALRPDDLTVQAGVRLNRAGNWQEFLAAARDFRSPQQNVVYADIDGNIGFVAAGKVPVRKPENDLKGLAPAPGWDSRYDWAGFIPFEELPQQYNPATHRIATANEKIVGPDYPHFITSEWSLPYRAKRIGAMLDARPRHDMESFASIQKDVLSLAAQELLPLLKQVEAPTDRARQAQAAVLKWNGEMDAERPEPLIFNAWMRAASRRIFADELGEDLMKDFWEHRNVHHPMVNALKNVNGQAAWCGNVTPGAAHGTAVAAAPGPNCAGLLAAALDDALAALEKQYGSDMSKWKWGEAHQARSEHRPFGKVAPLAHFFDIRVPSPGDTYTINVGRYNLKDDAEPFANRHAPSMRALYDLSNLENSRFIHSSGQSGNPLSPLYRNFTQRWADVAYVPMRTSRPAAEQGQLGTLTLLPAGGR